MDQLNLPKIWGILEEFFGQILKCRKMESFCVVCRNRFRVLRGSFFDPEKNKTILTRKNADSIGDFFTENGRKKCRHHLNFRSGVLLARLFWQFLFVIWGSKWWPEVEG